MDATEAALSAQDRNASSLIDAAGNEGDILDRTVAWFDRFIAMPDPDDLNIVALWTIHTHLATELRSSPRLTIDSTMPGSGKTTLLEHLNRLCYKPLQAAGLSSAAVLSRAIEAETRTVLLDEVDRTLRPDGPLTQDLLAILNTGYRVGAVRLVLVPSGPNGWEVKEMATFAPVAMAGNAPRLPDDTVQRSIRILLMPDFQGTVEDSDWEHIDDDAAHLHSAIAEWADAARSKVTGMAVTLPEGCVGRFKEKWRPLKRIAMVASGKWPNIVDQLIRKSLDEDAAESEAGLKRRPPGMVLLTDLHTVWPSGQHFVPTRELVSELIKHNPDYWGHASSYGKALTDTRLGMILVQAAKVTSTRPGAHRGYARAQLEPIWHRLGIARSEPGAPGNAGEPGTDYNERDQGNRDDQLHQAQQGLIQLATETVTAMPAASNTSKGGELCIECGEHPRCADGILCDRCRRRHDKLDITV
ncbi:MAG TPA: DUF3631 domain-containing protein [Mycobacterium sp.]|uniref:DUF3631 domain-containing protein n=1 Tax=Mycobacterium sp. TaxID=1785 RepID=UPI002BA6500B|nr:DUF3631 domain-containing protein [Mycobacterium sp.]HME78987.1 DUF3631 domain-containing protein [Mycobacterium sp.]